MTIQTGPSRVQYRFIGSVDRTLDTVARRYGTTAQAIFAINAPTPTPGVTPPFRTMREFLLALDDGYRFAIPTPTAEIVPWECVPITSNGPTLGAFCATQNRAIGRRGQPEVNPAMLWSYAVNAPARSAALAGAASPDQAREWEMAPDSARLVPDTILWLPYTQLMVGPQVPSGPGASHVVVVDPPWISAFRRHVARIRTETDRLRAMNRLFRRVENQCTRLHARVEFLQSYFELLHDDLVEVGHPAPWLADIQTKLRTLGEQSAHYLGINPVQYVRPDWVTEKDQCAHGLVNLLFDASFDEWLHTIQVTQSEYRDGRTLLADTYEKLRDAVQALGGARVDAFERVLAAIDPHLEHPRPADAPPRAEGMSLRTALGFMSSVAGASVANTPGPASLVVAIAQFHVFWKVWRHGHTHGGAITGPWIRELVSVYRPSAAAQSAFREALEGFRRGEQGAIRPAERAARALTGGVTQGPGWTGLLLLCNILSFYAMTSDDPGDRELKLSELFGLASTTIATGLTATQLVSQFISNLERNSQATRLVTRAGTSAEGFLERAGARAGWGNIAALLQVFSSLAVLCDAYGEPAEDRDSLHMFSLWMQFAGSAAVFAGSTAEVPLLMAAGVVVGLVATVAANWQDLTDSNVKLFARQQLALYSDEQTNDVAYHPVFVPDGHGGGTHSSALFRIVTAMPAMQRAPAQPRPPTMNAPVTHAPREATTHPLANALDDFDSALFAIPRLLRFISEPSRQTISIHVRLRDRLHLDEDTIDSLTTGRFPAPATDGRPPPGGGRDES